MRTLFFGTYDEQSHPRVQVLREGMLAAGADVAVANAPLGLSTHDRVEIARRPWSAPILVARILRMWVRLWRATSDLRPDVVVVGYLGHFDIHLARRRFPHAALVLDHMVGLGDTVRDRGLDGPTKIGRVLDRVDRAAVGTADIVLVDTEEQAATLPDDVRDRTLVVAVGAPAIWHAPRGPLESSDVLRVIFFGLFTPLQGAPVIGEALRLVPDAAIACTMVGRGQDLAATRAAVGDDGRVTWLDWVDAADLPELVAGHDVCLGIFGDGAKARRVVPNKVYQGAAAGCALVTSDTPPQRRLLHERALLVPPADPHALARALVRLATDRALLADLRSRAAELAATQGTPEAVIRPLLHRLEVTA